MFATISSDTSSCSDDALGLPSAQAVSPFFEILIIAHSAFQQPIGLEFYLPLVGWLIVRIVTSQLKVHCMMFRATQTIYFL